MSGPSRPRNRFPRAAALVAGAGLCAALAACSGALPGSPSAAPVPGSSSPDAPGSAPSTPAFTPAATPTVVAPGAYDKPSTGGVRFAPTASGPLDGKVIAVDPGHNTVPIYRINHLGVRYYGAGVRDCQQEGSTGLDKKTPEATIVWDIAQHLVPLLRERGATVVVSRPDDNGTGPCNDERAQIANRANADLLLSIHGDGSESQKNRGYFVMYSMRMLGGPEVENASRQAAYTMVNDLKAHTAIPVSNYIGTKRDGTFRKDNELGVLNTMKTGPALLIEVGNIRQTEDWAILSSDAGKQAFAEGLAAGAQSIVLGTPSPGAPVITPDPSASPAPSVWPPK